MSARKLLVPLDQALAAGALDVTKQALHNSRWRWKRACLLAVEEGREPPSNPWPIIHDISANGRGHQLMVDVVDGELFMLRQRRRPSCAARMAMLQMQDEHERERNCT